MEENVIEITLSPAKLFALYLQGRGISYTWVANNLDVTPTYISCLCSESLPMPDKMRRKLNELLDLNY